MNQLPPGRAIEEAAEEGPEQLIADMRAFGCTEEQVEENLRTLFDEPDLDKLIANMKAEGLTEQQARAELLALFTEPDWASVRFDWDEEADV